MSNDPAAAPDSTFIARRTMWGVAAAVLVAVIAPLAVVLAHESASPAPHATASGPLTFPNVSTPTTTTPVQVVLPPVSVIRAKPEPVVAASSGSAPAATPTTTTPRTTTAPPPPTTTVAPKTCTVSDLRFSTTTNAPAYVPGQPVQVVTKVTDVNACIFTPVSGGAYSCPTSITVSQGGRQEWPAAGQGEQCSTPQAMTMEPGTIETVSALWNGQVQGANGLQDAPPGPYTATGSWYWSGGSDTTSATFTIS